ncbi:titin-like isoform X2 [Genypterus blacodes]|uniref:titin-like isoform X2 n=1 Tax=Genypterus blacodes TaxID=154954 RepID=UPI003F76BC92
MTETMMMKMRITIALLLIIARYNAGQTLTRKVGTEVTLHPGPPAGSEVIRSGEWAFTGASGNLLVLDWDADGVTVYERFKDRCELNRTTGVLMIKALTLEDSGVYKAVINNMVVNSTHVSVLSPVPKPTVSESCNLALTRCVLTCDGDTTHAEPVTYDWSAGDRASISLLKNLTITQEEHGDDGEFSCVVKNDVSEERSERIANPFKTTSQTLTTKVGTEVTLHPGPPAGSEVIRSGEWAFTGASGSLLVVDWDAAGVTVYERFKDRCELNRTTGVLMIKALTWKDSGVYKAEINNKGADSTHVSVLSPVPKPTVSGSCHLTLTRCVLTCDGDTTHAEPVTYDWSSGDRASNSSLKSLTITQEEHSDDGDFSCVVKNDVGEERSERIANPFKTTTAPVPKPTVYWSCDLALTRCVLTCDGDTTHAEPVTYDWSSGDRASISSLKSLTITQEEHSDDGEFSCVVKNDVSEERSERIPNPFKVTSQTLTRKVGAEVTLHPGPPAGSKVIRSGEWAFTGASVSLLVVDWDADGVTVYERFKDRCELNRTTGVLMIKALTLKDSGMYKAEINNKGADSTHVSVLSPVPKPTVSESCNLAFTRCVLTCDGDTTHAEPVTYDWSSGDRASISSLKSLTITQEEHGDDGEFSCVVKNDVSEESSKRFANRFRRPDYNLSVLVGVGVFLSVAVLAVPVFLHKRRAAPVPKPTVSKSCDLALTRCVLTCDGDTTHAEPVTYDWSSGDRASISSLKSLTITQEEHGDDGEFSCFVKNDVSEERSERIANPFKVTNYNLSVGLVVGVFLSVLVLAVAVFLYKRRTGDKPGSTVFTLFGTFIFLGFGHIW